MRLSGAVVAAPRVPLSHFGEEVTGFRALRGIEPGVRTGCPNADSANWSRAGRRGARRAHRPARAPRPQAAAARSGNAGVRSDHRRDWISTCPGRAKRIAQKSSAFWSAAHLPGRAPPEAAPVGLRRASEGSVPHRHVYGVGPRSARWAAPNGSASARIRVRPHSGGQPKEGGTLAQGGIFEGELADGLLEQGEGAAQVGVLLPEAVRVRRRLLTGLLAGRGAGAGRA